MGEQEVGKRLAAQRTIASEIEAEGAALHKYWRRAYLEGEARVGAAAAEVEAEERARSHLVGHGDRIRAKLEGATGNLTAQMTVIEEQGRMDAQLREQTEALERRVREVQLDIDDRERRKAELERQRDEAQSACQDKARRRSPPPIPLSRSRLLSIARALSLPDLGGWGGAGSRSRARPACRPLHPAFALAPGRCTPACVSLPSPPPAFCSPGRDDSMHLQDPRSRAGAALRGPCAGPRDERRRQVEHLNSSLRAIETSANAVATEQVCPRGDARRCAEMRE